MGSNDNFRRCYYSSKPAKRPAQMPRGTNPADPADIGMQTPHFIGKWNDATGEYIGPCIAKGRELRFPNQRAAEQKAADLNALAQQLKTGITYLAFGILGEREE
jgi:hypothetical protein